MFKASDIDLHEVVIPGESEGVPVIFGEESEVCKAHGRECPEVKTYNDFIDLGLPQNLLSSCAPLHVWCHLFIF